jgi:hypothetical protein
MDQKTFEGTWDEIARRAPEWAGHRLRVTVLDHLATPETSHNTSADPPVASPSSPITGMFRDDADLLDEIVEDAMKIREERPWRLPPGE